MKRIVLAALAGLTFASFAVQGDEKHHKAEALTAGHVKKIDKDAGKISIAHEPIENLGMPKMTMVFRVKEPGMLDAVKEGDRVKFAADEIQGALTVTKIERVK